MATQVAKPQSKSKGAEINPSPNVTWWTQSSAEMRAQVAAQQVDALQNTTAGRVLAFNSNVDSYHSPERGALGSGAYSGYMGTHRSVRSGGMNKEQLNLPILWSVIQALASEIATQGPNAQFLTNGAKFKARMDAKLLTDLTRAVAEQAELDATTAPIFIDACVGGTGFIYPQVDWQTKQIVYERVFPNEIVTDPNDDIYGSPRSFYRIKYVDREELFARFPKANVEKLRTARTFSAKTVGANATQSNMVKTYECWHLPAGVKGEAGYMPGLHLFITSNDSLLDEPYERREHAIIEVRYDDRLMGFLGIGLCEALGSVQNHLNENLYVYQQSMRKHGVPHWLCKANSNISRQELNDLIGSVIYYTTDKPDLVTWPSMPADVMEMIDFDMQQIYQMSGVSLMAASAQKPSGLDSGEAIRAYVDTNSKRFQFLGKKWERFHVRIYKRTAELALEIAEKHGSYPVMLTRKQRGQNRSESLDWKDAKSIDREKWQIRAFPVSSLPSTPTGKLQHVKDMMELGPQVMDPLTVVELLDLPDVQNETNLILAGRRLVEQIAAKARDDGKLVPIPTDCIDPAWALGYVAKELAEAELEEAPPKNLEALRTLLLQIVDAQAAAAPPPMPAAPAMPPPAPGPAPMLPAAPQAPLATVAQPGQ